jgi:Ca2+-transporting ATPase
MGPTCSIFYEREPAESNIMNRPPRPQSQNIFSGKELLVSIIQGLVITSGLLTLYYYFTALGYPIEYVRNIIFTTLVLSNVFLTFVNRSFEESFIRTIQYKNALVPYVLAISMIFMLSIGFIGPIQGLFKVSHISAAHYAICIIVSLLCTGWFELYKSLTEHNHSEHLPKSFQG